MPDILVIVYIPYDIPSYMPYVLVFVHMPDILVIVYIPSYMPSYHMKYHPSTVDDSHPNQIHDITHHIYYHYNTYPSTVPFCLSEVYPLMQASLHAYPYQVSFYAYMLVLCSW